MFIRLHQKNVDRTQLTVNVLQIELFHEVSSHEETHTMTQLVMASGRSFYVEESPLEIERLMKERFK